MSYFSSTISGVAGLATGSVLAPASMLLGSGVGEVVSRAARLSPEQVQFVRGIGAVAGTSLLTGTLSSSSFCTGIKVASVALSAIMGSCTGLTTTSSILQRIHPLSLHSPQVARISLVSSVLGAVSGIYTGAVGSVIINPAVGCCLGFVSAYTISATGIISAATTSP